jgi:hypothetical protein
LCFILEACFWLDVSFLRQTVSLYSFLSSGLYKTPELDQAVLTRHNQEDDEAFLRRIIFPEEDRRRYTSTPWRGGYRWFRSANIVDLQRYRNPVERERILTALILGRPFDRTIF